MTFRLDHHKHILTILESLDSQLLQEVGAYFGGGTLLALDYGEYRWSKDIDFICSISDSSGYRHLRTAIFDKGYEVLFRNTDRIQFGRETTDQYGIRLVVMSGGVSIKTEIIAESRFQLDPPRYPAWSPVACLSLSDCFTSKLLSNSDRFMDNSVESRDLIDLAVLRLHSVIPSGAFRKAENAYEVIRPLKKAVQRFQEQEDYRYKCYVGLKIDAMMIPQIIDGIDLLAQDCGLKSTQRSVQESHNEFLES